MLMEALSPTRCAGCERPGVLVCDGCLERLSLIDPAASCVRCGAPFGGTLCTECRGAGIGAHRVLATAGYDGPLPRIIRAYKDAGERRLARVIAEMLVDTAEHAEATAADRFGGILSRADAIVPVPNTADAFRRRGFDHMVAIARAMGRISGVPVCDCMVKRAARDQRAMGREGRASAQRGAYRLLPAMAGRLENRRLLLVDDVITTGSTIRESCSALAGAGARRIDVLALARVW